MVSRIATSLVVAAALASAALAQGPIQRAGQALDNAGKNIRQGVENAVVRGQITAQEREVLADVSQRINRDKRLLGSAMQVVVEPGGVVMLRGSARDAVAKALAVELVENTVGVTGVVDELAVVEEVRVIEAAPALEPAARVLTVPAPSAKPVQSKAIIKP